MKGWLLALYLAGMFVGAFTLAAVSGLGILPGRVSLLALLVWLVLCVVYLAVSHHRADRPRDARPARCTPQVRSGRRVGGGQ